MYLCKFGQGKYIPMFGGLRIEKLPLEIHGQLIAGSELPWLLTIQNFYLLQNWYWKQSFECS